MAIASSVWIHAQLLTWTPPFPTENDNITITVDATKGNKGLLGYTGDVYVHVGAITSLSTSPDDWKHVPFTWGSTEAAAKATPAGTNKWSFTINNPRVYFSLAAGEQLKAIAILFRAGNCSSNCLAQRNADGSNMYVPIYTSALAVRIDQPARQPKYNPEPESQTWTVGSNIAITANANKTSALKLYHNGTVIATASAAQTLSGNSVVSAVGNQQLIAEANDGTTTKYDTVNIFVAPPGSPVAPLPAGVRDGINYEPGDTSVTLVLRAPNKNLATVIGDFSNWTQGANYIMNKTPDGKFFWIRLHPLVRGTEYGFQYVVDDTIKIADPYAEKILDLNDQYIPAAIYPNLKPYPSGQTGIVSVLQTGQAAYSWTTSNYSRPDKKGLVIYELLVRDFVAAHNWKAVQDSLNYLKNLGITAIEVMPFNEFEGNDSWGYNPDFYFAPDKYYGTATALKQFIDACHSKGIAVIMDIVLNHTFGPSPLARLYWDNQNNRPSADNPWYNPVQPHAFGFGDDFNHESADTKYFFNRVLQHWITEYKIDGYRFDFSKGLTQKVSANDAEFSANDPGRIVILNSYANTIWAADPNAYVILEHFADNTEEKTLSDAGMMLWSAVWTPYQEAAMGYVQNSNFSSGIHTERGWNKPHLVGYMESHDQERIVFKNVTYGNTSGTYNVKDLGTALKRMELDAAFLLTIPGPKMIWQFGELGYDYSINYCPNGTISDACRVSSKPIRWDYLADARRKSVFNTYSQLNALRAHPWYKEVFMSGTISQDLGSGVKWIRVSSGDTSHLVVVGNFDVGARQGSITFPKAGTWFDYLNNTTISASGSVQTVDLQPGEFHVYVNRNINNIAVTPVPSVPWNGGVLEARLFPNPVAADFTTEVNLPQATAVRIDLYNTVGQFGGTLYSSFLTKGLHQLTLNRAGATAGVWYLHVQTRTATKILCVTLQ